MATARGVACGSPSVAILLLLAVQLLFSPKDEIALVLFGSSTTKNDLQAQGYQNVQVLRGLCPPNIMLLQDIDAIQPGNHSADCTRRGGRPRVQLPAGGSLAPF